VEREDDLRQQLSETCRRLSASGLVAATEGGAAARLGAEAALVSPPQINRGRLAPASLLRVSLRDLPAWAAWVGDCFAARPDARALLWALPPHTVALGMANIQPAHCLLGRVPLAVEGPGQLRERAARADLLLLERSGVLSLGANLDAAFDQVEALEHAARITFLQRSLPGAGLSSASPDPMIAAARAFGAPRALSSCDGCGGCGRPADPGASELSLAARVAEQLAAAAPPPRRRATCGEAWWLGPEPQS
jgi:ribulose-5-phosphate 4-epimerase/fuculose-1-phosphate aldolase